MTMKKLLILLALLSGSLNAMDVAVKAIPLARAEDGKGKMEETEMRQLEEAMPDQRRKEEAKYCTPRVRGVAGALGTMALPAILRNLPLIGQYMPADMSFFVPAAIAGYTIGKASDRFVEDGVGKAVAQTIAEEVTESEPIKNLREKLEAKKVIADIIEGLFESPKFKELTKNIDPKVFISKLAQAIADQTEPHYRERHDKDLPVMKRIFSAVIAKYQKAGKEKEVSVLLHLAGVVLEAEQFIELTKNIDPKVFISRLSQAITHLAATNEDPDFARALSLVAQQYNEAGKQEEAQLLTGLFEVVAGSEQFTAFMETVDQEVFVSTLSQTLKEIADSDISAVKEILSTSAHLVIEEYQKAGKDLEVQALLHLAGVVLGAEQFTELAKIIDPKLFIAHLSHTMAYLAVREQGLDFVTTLSIVVQQYTRAGKEEEARLLAELLAEVTKSEQFETFTATVDQRVFVSRVRQALTEIADRDRPAMRRILRNLARLAIEEYKEEDGQVRKAVDFLIEEILKEDGKLRKGMEDLSKYFAEDFNKRLSEVLNELFGEGGEGREEGAGHKAIRESTQQIEQSIKKATAMVVLGGAALITLWFGSRVTWSHVDRMLGRPSLVQESSYSTIFDRMPLFKKKQEFPRLVFEPDLKKRLSDIIKATDIIRKRIKKGYQNVKYRNLLLWGLPGTGKTMFSRQLADEAHMDYDIMSGASFAQFANGEGITEMNRLYKRAESWKNGVIIIIDEADAFLGLRNSANLTQQAYQLLTNFLYLTGDGSREVMFVFCSNKPDVFDTSMDRRIHDVVEMKLPGVEQRAGILKNCRNELLLDPFENTGPFIEAAEECLSNDSIEDIAKRTPDLSGDELRSLINDLISDAPIANDAGVITPELLEKIVQRAIDKHAKFASRFAAES